MAGNELLNKLEENLKILSRGKILDVGKLDIVDAHILKRKYGNSGYVVYGPQEDNFNPGKYAISFFSVRMGGLQNA